MANPARTIGSRPAAIATAPGRAPGTGRASLGDYLRGVWDELKKVVWPTRDELWRMTGIVIATVILFAVIIGGADYVLSLGVKQVYQSTPTTTSAPAAPKQSSLPLPTRPAAPAPGNPTPVP